MSHAGPAAEDTGAMLCDARQAVDVSWGGVAAPTRRGGQGEGWTMGCWEAVKEAPASCACRALGGGTVPVRHAGKVLGHGVTPGSG